MIKFCRDQNRDLLHSKRLIYKGPPEDAVKVQPMPELPDAKAALENLSVEAIAGLKQTQESEAFGPIFVKMLEDKVQIQNWDSDFKQAEADMKKYFSGVDDDVKSFWFGGKNKEGNTVKGVFEKINMPNVSPEYKEAEAAIKAFRILLVNVHLRRHQEMIENQNETVTAEPVLSKTKEVVGDVINAFNEGDGTDKALMIGAAFLLYQAYDKLKGKKIPGTDIEFGDALMYGGMYWGANFLSLKVTGKSIPEHLGISDPKSDLKKTEYEKFARNFNITDGKTLDLMLQIGETKIDRLYALYSKNQDLKEPSIDPIAAGIDIPLDDPKLYKQRGIMLFNIMHALVQKAGGKLAFEKRYITAKAADQKRPEWNFRTVTWDLLRLESLKTGASEVELMMERFGVNVMGRRRMPTDTAHLRSEFPWPLEWETGFVMDWDQDEKNGNKQGDGKTEVTINGITFVTERSQTTDPTDHTVLRVYKFFVKGASAGHEITLDKEGKMRDGDRKYLEKTMEKEVKQRLNRHLFFQGRPITQDVKWIKEKGWVIENLNLPAVPALGLPAITGDVEVKALENDKVSIYITGLGANVDLWNQAANEGYQEHRVKIAILAQPEFKGLNALYPYMATKIDLTGPAAASGKVELSIGNAKLPLFFNTTTNKWQVDARVAPPATTGPNAAAIEQKFVSDPEVVKTFSEVQLKDAEFKGAFEEMKNMFTRMPESFFKNFGSKFWDIFAKFNLNEPTSSISGEMISGSVAQEFAYQIADYKKNETALRFREALKGAKTIKDIDIIRTNIVTQAITDIKTETQQLIVECNKRRENKQDFTSEESMEYINKYMATGYKSDYYKKSMLDFSKVAWEMDKSGSDKSDWNKNAHKVHTHLMMVVAYHTLDASNNPTLDDTNITDYAVQRENIEQLYGYDPAQPETAPVNVTAKSVAASDPRWQNFNNLYNRAYKSFKQQNYLDYVISQVKYKADLFANNKANVDAVIDDLPAPNDKAWEIIPESEFTVPTLPTTTNVLRGMPKLADRASVKTEMWTIMDEVLDEFNTPSYNYVDIKKEIDAMKANHKIDLGGGANIDLGDIVSRILALKTRPEQQEGLKQFKNTLRTYLNRSKYEKDWAPTHSVGYYGKQVWKKFLEFIGVI